MRLDNKTVWDEFEHEFVEAPAEMEAFIADIEAVCRKHGFSIGHEDGHGGFKIHLLSESNIRWFRGASKSYTKEVDPATGKMFAPAYMGDNCPSRDISCAACRYLDHCFPVWSGPSRKKREEIFANYIINQVSGDMALSGFELTDADKERIRHIIEHPEDQEAILQELIEKHRNNRGGSV